MAKDDLERVERDEDLPFEIPKFDEDEFVRKELISFRTTIVLFAFSGVTALLTYLAWKYMLGGDRAGLSGQQRGQFFFYIFVFAMAVGALVPWVYRWAKIDVGHFKRREWLGTATLHFFFWMGFTLLLVNPPITDNSPPVIDAHATPAVQGVGHDIQFAIYIADNKAVDEASIKFCLLKGSDVPATYGDLSATQQGLCSAFAPQRIPGTQIWAAKFTPDADGAYTYYVHAADAGGRARDARGVVWAGNPFSVVDPATGASFSRLSDTLAVKPNASFDKTLRAIQYVVDGKTYNMTKPSGQGSLGDYWTTNPTFPGWHAGTVNLSIVALEQPIYLHNGQTSYKFQGGLAQHPAANRTFTVDANYPELASHTQPELKENGPPSAARSPGPGGAWILVALVAALALVARRTRRHA